MNSRKNLNSNSQLEQSSGSASSSELSNIASLPTGAYSMLNLNTLDTLGLETVGAPLFDGLGARYTMRPQYFMYNGFKLYATDAASREALKKGLQTLADMSLPFTDNLLNKTREALLSKNTFIVGVNEGILSHSYSSGLTFFLGDGRKVILINTLNISDIPNVIGHEITHALTTSANPHIALNTSSLAFKEKFCTAFSTDFLHNANFKPASELEHKVKHLLFKQFALYPRAEQYVERVAFSVSAYIESPETVRRIAPHIASVIENELHFSSNSLIPESFKNPWATYDYKLPTRFGDLGSTISHFGVLGALHLFPWSLEVAFDYYQHEQKDRDIQASLLPGTAKFAIGVMEGLALNALSKGLGFSCGSIAWPLMAASLVAELPNIPAAVAAIHEAWAAFPGFPPGATLSEKAKILREFKEGNPLLPPELAGFLKILAGFQYLLETSGVAEVLRAVSPHHIYNQVIKERPVTLLPSLGAGEIPSDYIAPSRQPSETPQSGKPKNYLPIDLYPQEKPYYTPTPVSLDHGAPQAHKPQAQAPQEKPQSHLFAPPVEEPTASPQSSAKPQPSESEHPKNYLPIDLYPQEKPYYTPTPVSLDHGASQEPAQAEVSEPREADETNTPPVAPAGASLPAAYQPIVVPVKPRPRPPVIDNIRISHTPDGGIGLAADFNGSGTFALGFKYSHVGGSGAGHITLSLEAPLDKEALTALAAVASQALPVAIFAAVGWGIYTLITNGEDKRTNKRLNRHIKVTNEEAAQLQHLIEHDIPALFVRYNENPEQLISEIDKLFLVGDELKEKLPRRQKFAYDNRAFNQYFAYRQQEIRINQLQLDLTSGKELNAFIVKVDQSIQKCSKEEMLSRIKALQSGGLKTKYDSIEIQMYKQAYINKCIETGDTNALLENKELLRQSNGSYHNIRPIEKLKPIGYWCIKGAHKAEKAKKGQRLFADLLLMHNNLIVDPDVIANTEVGQQKIAAYNKKSAEVKLQLAKIKLKVKPEEGKKGNKTLYDYYAPQLAIMDENINSEIQSPLLKPEKLDALFDTVNEAALEQQREQAAYDASVAEFEKDKKEADELESNGFHGKAAKKREEAYLKLKNSGIQLDDEIKWNDDIKSTKMVHHFELADTWASPIEECIQRHVPDMPSFVQPVAKATFAITNFLQVMGIATHQPLSYLAIGAGACYTGDRHLLAANVKSDLEKWGNSIRNPCENDYSGWIVISKILVELLRRIDLERLLPKNMQASAKQLRYGLVRIGDVGNRMLAIHHAYKELRDMRKNGIVKAKAALYALTISQAVIDVADTIIQNVFSHYGKAIEDPNYYLCILAIKSVFDTSLYTRYVSALTRATDWTTMLTGGLYSVFNAEKLLCGATQRQAAAHALAAAMSNIDTAIRSPMDRIAIANSCKSIEKRLNDYFNGFAYNARQLAEANESRVLHLCCRMLKAYEAKNYEEIDHLSEKQIIDSKTVLINSKYRIPAHFAHRVVYYLFLAYVQSPAHLLNFRATYQEYSKYVIDFAPSSWLEAHLDSVKKNYENVVRQALFQLLQAANNAETPAEISLYLGLITEKYNFCHHWYELLKDDDHKFVAALLSFRSQNKPKCDEFLNHINLEQFISIDNENLKSHEALLMLESLRPSIYEKFVFSRSDETILSADMLQQHVSYLTSEKKYALALRLASTLKDYPGKYTTMASATYWSSEGKNILDTLQWLMREPQKEGNYWIIFYNLFVKCHQLSEKILFVSSKESYHRLKIFLMICAENCLKTGEFKEGDKDCVGLIDTIRDSSKILNFYVQGQFETLLSPSDIKLKFDALVENGQASLRGENGFDMMEEFKFYLSPATLRSPGANNANFSNLTFKSADNWCQLGDEYLYGINGKRKDLDNAEQCFRNALKEDLVHKGAVSSLKLVEMRRHLKQVLTLTTAKEWVDFADAYTFAKGKGYDTERLYFYVPGML